MKQKETRMLDIYSTILEVLRMMRGVLAEVERHDADLARQMRRAATSVALNVAEGSYSRGGNRKVRYHTALGSMNETMAGIEAAQALGYLKSVDDALVDKIRKVIGTLVRLAVR